MFTDRYLKSLKPQNTPHRYYENGPDAGFCIQVSPKGTKTFNLAATVSGKRRFVNLGRYPAISLQEARERARQARMDIDRGDSPLAAGAASQRRSGTVRDAIDLYLEDLEARGRRSIAEVRRSMNADVLPEYGDMLARDLRPSHVQKILADVIARGVAREHNKVRSKLHAAMNFALRYDYDPRAMLRGVRFGMTSNPVSAVPKDVSAHARTKDRALTFDEIKAVWNYPDWHPAPHNALRLILALGGLRPIEVLGARKSEFDMDAMTFTIPPERFKVGRYHVVPICSVAKGLLSGPEGLLAGPFDYIFPAPTDDGGITHYSVMNLGQYLRRQWDFRERRWPEGVARFTPYDLRRTWKTRTGELGIDKTIRDRIQGHAMSDVSSKHYDRWDYLPEKRQAMEEWDAKLNGLICEAS